MKIKKKVLSILIVVLLIIGSVNVSVFATDEAPAENDTKQEQVQEQPQEQQEQQQPQPEQQQVQQPQEQQQEKTEEKKEQDQHEGHDHPTQASQYAGSAKSSAKGDSYPKAPPHTHSWKYSAVGSVMKASCTCGTTATATLIAADKTYDGTSVVVTVDKSPNWTKSNKLEDPKINYSPSNSANAGTYTASISFKNGNKTVTASKSFTISKKTITAIVPAVNKRYDGTTNVTTDANRAVYTGLVSESDKNNLTLTVSGAKFADKNAGENKEITFTSYSLSGTAARNYNLESVTCSANIEKASVYVNDIKGVDKVYDGTTDAALDFSGMTLGGVINKEDVKVKTEGVKGTFENENVGTNKKVTLPELELIGTDASNYKVSSMSQKTTKASITAKTATIVWGETELVYNGGNQTPTATIEGAGSDGPKVTVTVRGSSKNVGTYTAYATLSGGGNYELAGETSTEFKIVPKTLTLFWSNTEFTYDGERHKPKLNVEGILRQDEKYVLVTPRGSQTDAGTYTATAQLTQPQENNYKLPENNTCQFVINPREVKVFWYNTSFTYDGTPKRPNAVITNVWGLQLTVTGEQTNAGTYTATATLSNNNYTLGSSATTEFTINPKPVTIVWGTTTFTYNGTPQLPTATIAQGGLVGNDTCVVTPKAFKNSDVVNAGSYFAYVLRGNDDLSNKNYTVVVNTYVRCVINKKDITITADNKESTLPKIEELTWAMEDEDDNWFEADPADIALAVTDSQGNPVILEEALTGEYVITPSWETENKNYNATFVSGVYSLHKLEKTEAKDPTCTDHGNAEYWTCKHEDEDDHHHYDDEHGTSEIEKDSWILSPKGHIFDDNWVVTTPPTTDAEGEETRKCLNCDETETRVIPKLQPVTYSYRILSKGWQKGSGKTLDIVVNRSVDDHLTYGMFVSLEVDGAVVPAKNYRTASGSLKMFIKPEYLETLADGDHTLKINFEDGSASIGLNIISSKSNSNSQKNAQPSSKKEASKTSANAPKTGDENNMAIWIALMAAAFSVLLVAGTRKRRNR